MNRIPENESGGGSAAKPLQPATRLVTAGRVPSEQYGFVNTPIYRGSTVLYPNAEKFLKRDARYTYGTKGTPTTNALETAWTEISGAAGTVLVPSGLAAISIALLSCLKAGDHLLVPDSVYRPTRNFCDTVIKRFGVETTYYDPLLGAESHACSSRTRGPCSPRRPARSHSRCRISRRSPRPPTRTT